MLACWDRGIAHGRARTHYPDVGPRLDDGTDRPKLGHPPGPGFQMAAKVFALAPGRPAGPTAERQAESLRPEHGTTHPGAVGSASSPGQATWTGGALASVLGISDDQVWRVLRNYGISLQRRRSWCISTDPEFAAKAADVIGLYLNPPEHALVLSVDEKPSIQALERAQGWIRLPNGKALTGFSHCYTRHGTTTLFAALNVLTGEVKAGHYARRRRREFLHFMNELVALHPDREIHVVLDNLNTHKPKEDRWLKRHPQVHFHYTPTYSSWLNQIECWFSILSRKALRGASFTSSEQVRQAINEFVAAHNQTAAPFEWKKATVHPSAPTHKYADLRN